MSITPDRLSMAGAPQKGGDAATLRPEAFPGGGRQGTLANVEARPSRLVRSLAGSKPRPFSVVRGSTQILTYQGALSRLAARCGDSDAMVHLPYFLSPCRLGAKVPHLLARTDGSGELESAVLLNEYIFWGVPTGVFVPADITGQRTVFTEETNRSALAEEAAVFLLQGRGMVVQVSVKDGNFSGLPERGLGRFLSTTQTRTIIQTLPLAETLDGTMAMLGAHTRRNLRHFRRRAETELGATFQVKVNLTEAAFLALNERTLYPVPVDAAQCRHRWLRGNAESFLVGLRGGDGAWLSLVGGRRHNGSTTIDWQMNANNLPAFSLGTAMRAFLLEHEIAQGTRLLTFDGGTPHSMHRAFVPETVSDLLLRRWFLPISVLRALIPPRLPTGDVLRRMLLSETLAWRG